MGIVHYIEVGFDSGTDLGFKDSKVGELKRFYRSWFIQGTHRPSFTVKAVASRNKVGLSELDARDLKGRCLREWLIWI